MTDPMSNIEDEKAQKDLGAMAWRVYQGAIEDGATHHEAVWILIGYFGGMFKGSLDDPKGGE